MPQPHYFTRLMCEMFRYKTFFPPLPPAPPQPVNSSLPSVNLSSIAGVYNNRGYGSFELCLVSPNITTASNSCKVLASNVSIILPGAVDPSGKIPTFLAEWNSPWMSHIKLTHWNGNTFNISILSSYVSTFPSLLLASHSKLDRLQAILLSPIGQPAPRMIPLLAHMRSLCQTMVALNWVSLGYGVSQARREGRFANERRCSLERSDLLAFLVNTTHELSNLALSRLPILVLRRTAPEHRYIAGGDHPQEWILLRVSNHKFGSNSRANFRWASFEGKSIITFPLWLSTTANQPME
jgi:hypothetical protein